LAAALEEEEREERGVGEEGQRVAHAGVAGGEVWRDVEVRGGWEGRGWGACEVWETFAALDVRGEGFLTTQSLREVCITCLLFVIGVV